MNQIALYLQWQTDRKLYNNLSIFLIPFLHNNPRRPMEKFQMVPKSEYFHGVIFTAEPDPCTIRWCNKYTVFQKITSPLMFDNNFGKCEPIFKILSPGDS